MPARVGKQVFHQQRLRTHRMGSSTKLAIRMDDAPIDMPPSMRRQMGNRDVRAFRFLDLSRRLTSTRYARPCARFRIYARILRSELVAALAVCSVRVPRAYVALTARRSLGKRVLKLPTPPHAEKRLRFLVKVLYLVPGIQRPNPVRLSLRRLVVIRTRESATRRAAACVPVCQGPSC